MASPKKKTDKTLKKCQEATDMYRAASSGLKEMTSQLSDIRCQLETQAEKRA